jgi:hypothetical protein
MCGLRTGRSRKQYRPYLGRTGDPSILQTRETFKVAGTQAGAGTYILYTVGASERVRVIRGQITDDGGTGSVVDLELDNFLNTTGGTASEVFTYDDAPLLESNQRLRLGIQAGAGAQCTYSFILARESAARGFFDEEE